jgi:hypothetical protein
MNRIRNKANEQHVLVLDRAIADTIMHVSDGTSIMPVPEFLKRQPRLKKGQSQMIPVTFGSSTHNDADLGNAAGIASRTTLEGGYSHQVSYQPVVSFGFMDRDGNLFPGHADSMIPASSIPWGALTLGTYSIRINQLVSAMLHQTVDDLMDATNPLERIPAYSGSRVLGAHLLGSYLFTNEEKHTHPVLLIRAYVILDKLIPSILDSVILSAPAQADPNAYLSAGRIEPVDMEQYLARYVVPKVDSKLPFAAQASVLVSKEATREWLNRALKETLDARAFSEQQAQAVQAARAAQADQAQQAKASSHPDEIASS